MRLEVDKPEDEEPIKYSPGDHVAVYPHHTDSEVNFVMEHLTKKPSDLKKELILREYNQNEGKHQGYLDYIRSRITSDHVWLVRWI